MPSKRRNSEEERNRPEYMSGKKTYRTDDELRALHQKKSGDSRAKSQAEAGNSHGNKNKLAITTSPRLGKSPSVTPRSQMGSQRGGGSSSGGAPTPTFARSGAGGGDPRGTLDTGAMRAKDIDSPMIRRR